MEFLVAKLHKSTQKFLIISITQDTPRGGWLFVSLAGAGFEPATSDLWGRQANHCSTPQYKSPNFLANGPLLREVLTTLCIGHAALKPAHTLDATEKLVTVGKNRTYNLSSDNCWANVFCLEDYPSHWTYGCFPVSPQQSYFI